MSDGKIKYTLIRDKEIRRDTLDESKVKQFIACANAFETKYSKRRAVKIGPVEVMVYVKKNKGQKYVFDSMGNAVNEKLVRKIKYQVSI